MRNTVIVILLHVVAGCSDAWEARKGGLQGPSPTNPMKAVEWERMRLVDENGRIPDGALEKALAQRKAMVEYYETMDLPMKAGLSPGKWREKGPYNVGGRTRSLVIDPRNPMKLVAGSVGGGIWISADGGRRWKTNTDWLPNLAVCCLARDPNNPDIIYAGTGEGYANIDAIRGMGIYKSLDGGNTWTILKSTKGFYYVNRVAVSPADGKRILAGVRPGGILLSADGGKTWKKTCDAVHAVDIDFHPKNGNYAVAAIYKFDKQKRMHYYQILYSTDGGNSWKEEKGLGRQYGFNCRIELAYAPSVSNMVYACCGAGGGKIWRSTDYGKTFRLMTSSSCKVGCNWYADSLWVDPVNPNFILAGGALIYRSRDGGTTLENIGKGYIMTPCPHPDIHCFVSDPNYNGTTNRKLYVCTDGGIWFTKDIYTATKKTGWERRDLNYVTTQFYGIAGDGPTGRMVGGTQDNGTLCLRDWTGTDAVLTFGGDGGACAIDPTDARFLYGEYVGLRIHRSADGGLQAFYICRNLPDAGKKANFIAPFLLDPVDPNIIFAGGRSLWISRNVKTPRPSDVKWSRILGEGNANICAIAVSKKDHNVIWVGRNDGTIYMTKNGRSSRPTWYAVDDNGSVNPLPDRFVADILIDNYDPNTVYVALGGFRPDNLYKTGNGGASWTDVTGTGSQGLPDVPVFSVAQHPYMRDWIYVSTIVGVFATESGGYTWSTANDGPANVSVNEVRFMEHSLTLMAGTHGRGIFYADIERVKWQARPFGQGCRGSAGTPALKKDPHVNPVIGSLIKLRVQNLPLHSFGWIVLGFSKTKWGNINLPLDLGPFGMGGCSLYVSMDLLYQCYNNGFSEIPFSEPVPLDPVFVGTAVYFQYLSRDKNANRLGFTVSNALEIRIGG